MSRKLSQDELKARTIQGNAREVIIRENLEKKVRRDAEKAGHKAVAKNAVSFFNDEAKKAADEGRSSVECSYSLFELILIRSHSIIAAMMGRKVPQVEGKYGRNLPWGFNSKIYIEHGEAFDLLSKLLVEKITPLLDEMLPEGTQYDFYTTNKNLPSGTKYNRGEMPAGWHPLAPANHELIGRSLKITMRYAW